jgi:hypothetical protein
MHRRYVEEKYLETASHPLGDGNFRPKTASGGRTYQDDTRNDGAGVTAIGCGFNRTTQHN